MSYFTPIIGANMIYGTITPVLVTPPPIANPQDLIYTLGGLGLTTQGVSGTIYQTASLDDVIKDNVTPPDWYHGAHAVIELDEPVFYDFENIIISNSKIELISPEKKAGLFENTVGSLINVLAVESAVGEPQYTIIKIDSPSNYSIGDRILIEGTNINDGIYLITDMITAGSFDYLKIFYDSTLDPIYISGGTVKKFVYLWDEVFTTPLGLYSITTSPPSNSEFAIIGVSSNNIEIVITDPNIVPKTNDFLVIQKVFQNTYNPTSFLLSTTDGVNNIINIPSAETYVFRIISVSNINELYSLTLDKSFTAPIDLEPKFSFILLNRKDVVYKNLFEHTWEIHESHREQMLGDPYYYQGIALPGGRSNYLYYTGSAYLGIENLIKDFLPTDNTPFIVMHYNDKIKDRIYNGISEFELHLPNTIIQNEITPTILTNKLIHAEDVNLGKYAALFTKYGLTDVIYGYVFFDLRIVVITHSELATALGYNSNRNFTLPTPQLPNIANSLTFSNMNNPLAISKITPGGVVNVTTATKHNMLDGEVINIKEVIGYTSLNTTTDTKWYVKRNTNTGFDPEFDLLLYINPALTIGVGAIGSIVFNTGICYGEKLPYEYFLTYRLISENYESVPYSSITPFNFATPSGSIDNVNGNVEVNVEFLKHLICSNGNIEGFNATDIEIIIGKYKQSLADPLINEGVEEVKLVSSKSLFSSGVEQYSVHVLTINVSDYNSAPFYDIINVQPIYDGITIPETLFVGESEWLLGNVVWKEQVEQFRLTFDLTIPANKWNGTTNPTFETGNFLMQNKFISELAFILNEDPNNVNENPYIYAKIKPVIKKSNQSDVKVRISVDF